MKKKLKRVQRFEGALNCGIVSSLQFNFPRKMCKTLQLAKSRIFWESNKVADSRKSDSFMSADNFEEMFFIK